MGRNRYVIKFAFDGADFDSYARQPTGTTVEGELIDALAQAHVIEDAKGSRFTSGSRVDKGVSALGASAALDTEVDAERLLRSLNANSGSIVAHSIATVERTFDPRRMADRRWYRFHFGESSLPERLDVGPMKVAAEAFLGEHDFSSFARLDGRTPTRVIELITIERHQGGLVLDVWGKSFLWNQVRRMVSALEMVGSGQMGSEGIADALRDPEAGPFPPAPAHGLFLMDVVYDGLEFRTHQELPKGTTERLRDELYRRRSGERYLEYLRDRVGF